MLGENHLKTKGLKKRMSLQALDRDRWEVFKQKGIVEGSHGRACGLYRKRAVKEWVTQWCAAAARNECADFELWNNGSASSPHDDAAVADTAVADNTGDDSGTDMEGRACDDE